MNYEEEMIPKIVKLLETHHLEPGEMWHTQYWRETREYIAKKVIALFPEGLLKLLDDAKCPECGGSGEIVGADQPYVAFPYKSKCPTCKGTGMRDGLEIVLIDTKVTWEEADGFHKVVKRL